jgi:hypothetical protein
MYYGGRFYDPQLGRFTSADTVVDGPDLASGFNRYMYCHGNPINYTDPTGHGGAEGDSDNPEGDSNNKGSDNNNPGTKGNQTSMAEDYHPDGSWYSNNGKGGKGNNGNNNTMNGGGPAGPNHEGDGWSPDAAWGGNPPSGVADNSPSSPAIEDDRSGSKNKDQNKDQNVSANPNYSATKDATDFYSNAYSIFAGIAGAAGKISMQATFQISENKFSAQISADFSKTNSVFSSFGRDAEAVAKQWGVESKAKITSRGLSRMSLAIAVGFGVYDTYNVYQQTKSVSKTAKAAVRNIISIGTGAFTGFIVTGAITIISAGTCTVPGAFVGVAAGAYVASKIDSALRSFGW